MWGERRRRRRRNKGGHPRQNRRTSRRAAVDASLRSASTPGWPLFRSPTIAGPAVSARPSRKPSAMVEGLSNGDSALQRGRHSSPSDQTGGGSLGAPSQSLLTQEKIAGGRHRSE